MFNKVRILVVDNDPTSRMLSQAMLFDWGYEPVLVMGTGSKLIADAKTLARDKRCGLALIDMRLYDDDDNEDDSGLKLANEFGDRVHCIILSGYENPQVFINLIRNHKNLNFIPKGDPPDTIKVIIDAEARKISAAKRGLEFENLNIFDEISYTALGSLTKQYPDQIGDILARLFPEATTLRVDKLNTFSLESKISTAPRPASIVLNVYQEQRYEPTIVKIARSEKIEEEVNRYYQHIDGKVTERFTGRLVRYGVLWEIGGVAYSYPGDNYVIPFSKFYEEKPISDIEECLKFFFIVVWHKHYLRAYDKPNISLYKLYTEVWGNWFSKCMKAFPITKPLDIGFATKELKTPEPIQWLKTRIVENPDDISVVSNSRIAITHGDLHGDNLLVDSNKNALVIDFERCGEGHALQDFIELEADIITRLRTHSQSPFENIEMLLFILRHKRIQSFEDLETFTLSENRHIQKALQIISTLRSLAFQCTGITDAREYVIGLLFNILFRAAIAHNKNPQQKGQHQALILASVICHRLDHWDEPWPPEWESLLK